jgi:hypothetical protein
VEQASVGLGPPHGPKPRRRSDFRQGRVQPAARLTCALGAIRSRQCERACRAARQSLQEHPGQGSDVHPPKHLGNGEHSGRRRQSEYLFASAGSDTQDVLPDRPARAGVSSEAPEVRGVQFERLSTLPDCNGYLGHSDAGGWDLGAIWLVRGDDNALGRDAAVEQP